jgi:hypothetical protein
VQSKPFWPCEAVKRFKNHSNTPFSPILGTFLTQHIAFFCDFCPG